MNEKPAEISENDPKDILKILVATDVHLGFMEKDGVRGKDAMSTFEEVLELGVKNDVDFVLLGGDLFHENKPSRNCMQGTIELLRRYCMGDKPCEVEFLSDPSINFGHTAFPTVNYADPNYNISMPVFSIHGNHDDPTGQGNYCTLDMLHAAGLVNYFGKCTSLDAIEMSPLLMEKGATRLALYGLGSVRDERLHRLFRNKAVKMLRPREQQNNWFNLLVLHQNHVQHGAATNYIPEHFLDEFLDLIIWGHEHECLIDPVKNVDKDFYVTQPGSTVATSLSEGETREKHCALVVVSKKFFKIKKIRLETVRQFYMDEIVLSETAINPGDPDATRRVESYCTEKVQHLLDKAERERIGNMRRPDKPLIRLRIDYSGGFEPFSVHRFGQKFLDRVANPKDLVLFHRRRNLQNNDQKACKGDNDEVSLDIRAELLDTTRVEDMVREYFTRADKVKQLHLLTERGMSEAVKEFVDKEERDAIPELVKYQLMKTQEYLRKRNTSEDALDAEVMRFKEERKKNVKEEDAEVQEAIVRARANRPRDPTSDNEMEVAGSDDDVENSPVARGRGRGRGARGGRGSTRGSSTTSSVVDGAPRGGRGRGSRGGRAKGSVVPDSSRSNKTIKDAFSSKTSRSIPSTSFTSRVSGSSDEECTIVDSGSDNELFTSKATVSRMSTNSTANTSHGKPGIKSVRKGVSFDSDEEDADHGDEFEKAIPARKKRR